MEESHFWFTGKRLLLHALLDRAGGAQGRVLDVGCGTGGVLLARRRRGRVSGSTTKSWRYASAATRGSTPWCGAVRSSCRSPTARFDVVRHARRPRARRRRARVARRAAARAAPGRAGRHLGPGLPGALEPTRRNLPAPPALSPPPAPGARARGGVRGRVEQLHQLLHLPAGARVADVAPLDGRSPRDADRLRRPAAHREPGAHRHVPVRGGVAARRSAAVRACPSPAWRGVRSPAARPRAACARSSGSRSPGARRRHARLLDDEALHHGQSDLTTPSRATSTGTSCPPTRIRRGGWPSGVFPSGIPTRRPVQPFLATLQPGALYPARLLLLVFDPAQAMAVSLCAHLIGMVVATYAFGRALGTSRLAASAAAIVLGAMLAGNQFYWPSYFEAGAWWPVLALALVRVVGGGGWRWVLLLGVSGAMPVLAGGYQMTVYMGYALVLLAVGLLADSRYRRASWGTLAVHLGVAGVIAGRRPRRSSCRRSPGAQKPHGGPSRSPTCSSIRTRGCARRASWCGRRCSAARASSRSISPSPPSCSRCWASRASACSAW